VLLANFDMYHFQPRCVSCNARDAIGLVLASSIRRILFDLLLKIELPTLYRIHTEPEYTDSFFLPCKTAHQQLQFPSLILSHQGLTKAQDVDASLG
jgi:hypothetical protein